MLGTATERSKRVKRDRRPVEELLQTVAILGAALAFTAKLGMDAYRRRNGRGNNPGHGNPGNLADELRHFADRVGSQLQQSLTQIEHGREDRELKDLLRELIREVKTFCTVVTELSDELKRRPCMARDRKEVKT